MADQHALPHDVQQLIQGLPQDKADEILSKLLEVAALEYRPIKEPDVRALKAKGAAQFGMMDADMDITWEELRQKNCIAIGAFNIEEQPVAFIVAELARLRDAQEFWDQDDIADSPATAHSPLQSPPSTPFEGDQAHLQGSQHSSAAAMSDQDLQAPPGGGSQPAPSSNKVHQNAPSLVAAPASSPPPASPSSPAAAPASPSSPAAPPASASSSGPGLEPAASPASTSSAPSPASSSGPGLEPAASLASTSSAAAPASSSAPGLVDVQALLQRTGCDRGDALVLGIRLLGVDFEYRRQGVGTQLLDFAKEVAQLASARLAWLNVADFNPAALKFWEAAGFQRTSRIRRSEQGSFPLYVLPLEPVTKQQKGARGRKGSKPKAPAQKAGKGFGQVRASMASSLSPQLFHTPARGRLLTSRARFSSSSRLGLPAQAHFSRALLLPGSSSGLCLPLR